MELGEREKMIGAAMRSRVARVGSAWFAASLLIVVHPAASATVAGLRIEGHLEQGGLVIGHTRPGTVAKLDGRRIQVSGNGVFLLGFGRDAKPRARLELRFADGTSRVRALQVAQRKYRVQRINGLPNKMVSPGKRDLKRILAEAAEIKAARRRDEPREDFLGGFEWPLHGRFSGVYGSQRVLNGKPLRPHLGLDIAAPTGTLIRAPAPGIVSLAEPDLFFTGGTLMIDHGRGLSSIYAHMSKLLVKKGQRVRRGLVIGKVGATGRVTGPHLHWGVTLFDVKLDPELLVGPMPSE